MKGSRVGQNGFILTVVLIIISLCVMLATYFAYDNAAFSPWASSLIKREKALMLAESGINVALTQLGIPPKTEKEKEGEEKNAEPTAQPPVPGTPPVAPQSKSGSSKDQDFLRVLLPIINRWQEFTFTKKNDGFDGNLRLCVVCENAKINLNIAYDFEKHDFASPDNKKLMETVFERLASITKEPNLFGAFERYVKDRKYKLEDVTELMMIKEFEQFKGRIFYEPPAKVSNESKEKKVEPLVYLTDLFTIEPERGCVQPWVLTDSVCAIYGFKRANEPINKEVIEKVAKDFKKTASWEKEWDSALAELYGKKYADITDILKKLLATKFGLTHFSVVSYGTVGGVTQRVVAIVERKDLAASSGGQGYTLTVKKRYRL